MQMAFMSGVQALESVSAIMGEEVHSFVNLS